MPSSGELRRQQVFRAFSLPHSDCGDYIPDTFIVHALRRLGYLPSVHHIDEFISRRVDINFPALLNYALFSELCDELEASSGVSNEDILRAAEEVFGDGSEVLAVGDFKGVMQRGDDALPDEEFDALIHRLDPRGSGVITKGSLSIAYKALHSSAVCDSDAHTLSMELSACPAALPPPKLSNMSFNKRSRSGSCGSLQSSFSHAPVSEAEVRYADGPAASPPLAGDEDKAHAPAQNIGCLAGDVPDTLSRHTDEKSLRVQDSEDTFALSAVRRTGESADMPHRRVQNDTRNISADSSNAAQKSVATGSKCCTIL